MKTLAERLAEPFPQPMTLHFRHERGTDGAGARVGMAAFLETLARGGSVELPPCDGRGTETDGQHKEHCPHHGFERFCYHGRAVSNLVVVSRQVYDQIRSELEQRRVGFLCPEGVPLVEARPNWLATIPATV